VADITSGLAPGTNVGGFVIEALLGAGGIATVYRAYEPSLHRRVALKLLAPELTADHDFARQFRDESLHAAQLQHPDIVTVYEVGRDGDESFVAMRLVTGSTLESMLARRGQLRATDALAILERAAAILDHAHQRGFVHGDLKPSNIFLEHGGQVSLADFGPSKATVMAASRNSPSIDRPLYLAPEQAAGREVDARSDLFSFACIAFECLTGKGPYRRDEVAGFVRTRAAFTVPSAAARAPGLPAAVDAVFERALATEPANRPSSATELVDGLRNALALGSATAGAPAPDPDTTAAATTGTDPSLLPSRASRTRRTPARPGARRWLVIVVGVAVLAALVGAALFSFGSGGGNTTTTSAAALRVTRTPLIFSAPLDGTDAGFVDNVGRATANGTVVKAVPGALELSVGRGGDAGRDLRTTAGVVDYILAIDLAVTPGSQVTADIGLRWAPDSKVGELLRIDTIEGHATFARFERGATPAQSRILAVGDQVQLRGITTGRVQHLAILVRGPRLELYRDGVRLVSTADGKMPSAPTSPGIDVLGQPGGGTVRILGLQLRGAPPD
jgi:serine/threonine-protein kinase